MRLLPFYKIVIMIGLILYSILFLLSCSRAVKVSEQEKISSTEVVESSNNSKEISSTNDEDVNQKTNQEANQKTNQKANQETNQETNKETNQETDQEGLNTQIANNYAQIYVETGELPSLASEYKEFFKIGVAISKEDINNEKKAKLILEQFNSITCENEMKADFKLDRDKTIALGNEEYPVVNMSNADVALSFAYKNGLKMRGHTLVWHSQTPRWLFTVGFDNDPKAPFVTREVMLVRMENYIRQEMEYVNTNYPEVIYAWDVVNEGIEPNEGHEYGYRIKNNYWYEVIGDDFMEMAFTYARKYATTQQKLFYNDYGTYDKGKLIPIYNLASKLKEKNLIDGIGMQDHIGIDNPATLDYQYAIKKYAELGLEIQITELDINTNDNSQEAQDKLATRYRTIMTVLKNFVEKDIANITSVTFWGLTDDRSWLNKSNEPNYPLLFDKDFKAKPAYFGVLQDDSVKKY